MKKLRSNKGESIAETLISLLIACVALIMLAGMITAATKLVSKSKTSMQDYYTENNSVATGSTTSGTGSSTTITISTSPSSQLTITQDVTYYQNNTFSNSPVIAYEIPGSATSSSGAD